MSQGIVSVAYIGATVLFILALGGLSRPETSRRGNYYGIIGMFMALLATIIGIVSDNYFILFLGFIVGGSIGLLLAKKVQMTQMPELVAILHSLVGLAAVLVGFANFMDHTTALSGVDKTIHDVETYLGILIGALTFSGSIIAFLKLSARISGKPMLLPARHWLNLALLVGRYLAGCQICQPVGSRRWNSAACPYDYNFPCFRSAYGHGHRRGRYAGGCLHAQQLFRMGGRGNGIYAEQ